MNEKNETEFVERRGRRAAWTSGVEAHDHYEEVPDPILSMSLSYEAPDMYINVMNIGQTAVKSIDITIEPIKNKVNECEHKEYYETNHLSLLSRMDGLWEVELKPNQSMHERICIQKVHYYTKTVPHTKLTISYCTVCNINRAYTRFLYTRRNEFNF